MTLKQKFIIIFCVVLAVFSGIAYSTAYLKITDMVDSNFYKNIETSGELGYTLIDLKYPGEWHVQDGQLYKGNFKINDNFQMVDDIKKTTGYLVTIFLNDTRVSTTIVNETGSRAVGTTASKEVIETVLKKGEVFHGQTRVLGKDVITYYRPLKDDKGKVIGMWFTGIEKTEINNSIREIMNHIAAVLFLMVIWGISVALFFEYILKRMLTESEQKYRMIFDSARDSIIVHDMSLQILAVNAIACKRYGYSKAELMSLPLDKLEKQGGDAHFRDQKGLIDNCGYALHETIHCTKNGMEIFMEVSAQKMIWNGRPAILSVCRDITDRKKDEKEILFLSYHDKLTGLYNRRFCEEKIKTIDLEEDLPLSIVVADVNGLKLMNDAFGHDKGDELLKKAAAAIEKTCRPKDIAARWGGDEFVILLPRTKYYEVEGIIKKIKDSYSKESVNTLDISISFGWETKKYADQDMYKILKIAEDKMYKHKLIENEGSRGDIITTIINTLHEKNPREELHSKRVGEMCQNIGKMLDLTETEISMLKVGGLLHDIGKIAIDEGILNKPGKLTDQEIEQIRRHPDIGYRILSSSYNMLELAECILAHHERWDGTGYPKGLKGKKIPKIARIIALADSWDAMISGRPYRRAYSKEEAIIEIGKNFGTQFDPHIAAVFIESLICSESVGK